MHFPNIPASAWTLAGDEDHFAINSPPFSVKTRVVQTVRESGWRSRSVNGMCCRTLRYYNTEAFPQKRNQDDYTECEAV